MPAALRRSPFLFTVSATILGACGGDVTSSSNPPAINCPTERPTAYDACALKLGESCSYDVACQSGTQRIAFECQSDNGTGWQVVEGQSCMLAYDSCPNTELYCGEQWTMPLATNPPAPCPNTPPAVSTSCEANVMGAVRERCGYRCGDDANAAWQVLHCQAAADSMTGMWVVEKSCD